MKSKTPLILFGLVALLLVIALAARVLAANGARPTMFLLSSGGAAGETYAGNGTLSGSLGQPVAGRVSNTDYGLCSGFWCGAPPPASPSTIFLPLVIRNYPPLVEIDDAPETCPGYLITVGTLYHDNFDRELDKDWYQFTAVGGTTYRIETGNLEPQADTVLFLYKVDCGELIISHDDISWPTNVASLIEWTAPANGVYHIRVESHDWRVYGAQTGYTVRVQTEQ